MAILKTHSSISPKSRTLGFCVEPMVVNEQRVLGGVAKLWRALIRMSG